MTANAIDQIRDVTSRLPRDAVLRLAAAAREGTAGLRRLQGQADSPGERHGCQQLLGAAAAGTPIEYLAGALAMAAALPTPPRMYDVVWTGPGDGPGVRLTLAVIRDLLAMASEELLLISFATYGASDLSSSLAAAHARGVAITMVLERGEDNSAYTGPPEPFPELPATRLAWPSDRRPAGAALHAKVLVVDRAVALVGSANLTNRAFVDNIECGVLHRDPVVAGAIIQHVEGLQADGVLVRV